VVEAVNELIAPHYTGALGIDMLAYRDSGCVVTVPCVEVNLRHTMGHVTCALAARHGLRGTFGIEYRGKDGSWHDGRRYLTPAFSSTRYRAYIE
ncbi:MAG: hypothetical protein IK092_00820, partial [Muribaculaceae bacterium]|nr:hypothetical protein [Muribaculaceae bacterium]